jgi:hypothetical protein
LEVKKTMAEANIANMVIALQERQFPSITLYNRLEGRPRTLDFDRALKAEVRDPLWMLTRQWQMGEFEGDDAGSPIFAKIDLNMTSLQTYQPDNHPVQPFEINVPMEAKVEQRPLPLKVGEQAISLDLRLVMGRHWLKLTAAIGFRDEFIAAYAIDQPDTDKAEDAAICAHPETWQRVMAVAGRAMDGGKLYLYLKESETHRAHDGIPMTTSQQEAIDIQADAFLAWFNNLFYQPATADENAWMPSYLEYQFSTAAPESENGAETVFTADEYYHGRLDWYNLDIDHQRETLGTPGDLLPASPDFPPRTQSFIPTQLTFDGMPHPRWWRFENGRTNFGDIKPGTKDLSKLLLMEFGLVYANDWFLLPLTLPIGTVTQINGLEVTNVFGERTWIKAAGKGKEQDWTMYTMAILQRDEYEADTRLLLLPTVPQIQESRSVEEVMFIRDETANMVWGIETIIPLPSGQSKAGREAAYESRNFYQRLVNEALSGAGATESGQEAAAPIRYQVMVNPVPDNWIPFIPVHIPEENSEDNREIQLQRAALPRILEGDPAPPQKIRPRTILLREGLDGEQPEPYFIHEEEVPRAGIRVAQTYQRTRWCNGQTFVWFGIRKMTGKGEGASNLAFDRLILTA